MAYLDFSFHLTLPVILCIISGFLDRRWPYQTGAGAILQGGMFGAGAVMTMLGLMYLGPSFAFHSQSIIISLCSLFFGPTAAVVAVGITLAGGLWLGDANWIWGWLSILSSSGIGLLAHNRFNPADKPPTGSALYVFGLLIHLVTLALVAVIINDSWSTVIINIAPPILLLCPLATLFAGKTLSDQFTAARATRERMLAEKAVREREVFLDTLINSIPTPIFYKDREGRYLGFNRAFETFFGATREELIGKTVFEIHSPDHAKTYWEKDADLFENGGTQRYEFQLMNAQGTLREVLFDKAAFTDETGTITGLIGTILDITDRKQTEKELQRSNDLLRAIIEAAPTAVIGLDLDGHVHSVWNHAAEKMLGWKAEEVMGRPLPTVPLAQKEEFSRFREKIRSGKTLSGVEVVRQRKDGTPINYSIYASPLYDPDGRITGNIAVLVDITERKQAERAIAQSEAKLRTLLDNIGIGVCLISPQMKILEINRRMREWFPQIDPNRQPVCYRAFNDPPRDQVCDYCPTCKTLKDGQVHEATSETPQAGGIRNFRILSSPILNESGEITAAVEIVDDVTENLSLESQLRQAQKMESIGRLAGGVAHDYNNMLAVIIGHVDMALQKEELTEPLRNHLQSIRKSAQRSADLTRQLLAFARKQTVMPIVLDLNKTIKGMLKMLPCLIGENIELIWRPSPGELTVKMDPSQIDQVLANLCVNARDAISGIGMILIETGKANFDAAYCAKHPPFLQGDFVKLVVSDDGHGMDKKTLDNIFEPFFTTKEMGKGTGLGLATVYGIIKQNNGFINVKSEPDHGTSFEVYLPQHEAETLGAQEEDPDIPLARAEETILLVEDEPLIMEITKLTLEELNYRVLTALTPSEAIRVAREHADQIDLLLTDVVMPEMNGRDLAEHLRRIYPGLQCLFMSGYTRDVIAHHGILDEGIDYIQKPFSVRALAEKLHDKLAEDSTKGNDSVH